jgi:hypothetical protein
METDVLEQLQNLMKALEAGSYGHPLGPINPNHLLQYFKRDPNYLLQYFKRDPSIKHYQVCEGILPTKPERFVLNPFCKENNFPEMSEKEIIDFITVSLKMNS